MFISNLILGAMFAVFGVQEFSIQNNLEGSSPIETVALAVEEPRVDATKEPPKTKVPPQAEWTLADGSTLFGVMNGTDLRFYADIGQELTLPVEMLASVDININKETAEVAFTNGDRLTGRLIPHELEMSGILGTITIPVASIKRISFGGCRQKVDNGLYIVPDKKLLYWNTFDSLKQARGPEAGTETVLGDVAIVPGKIGNALHTQGNNDVAAFTFPPHRLKTAGTIEFWAKLDVQDVSFSQGVHPRFFWLSRVGHDAGTRLDFSSNNGDGTGGLCSTAQNLSCGTGGGNTYRSILGPDYAGWHHYALVWDKDGLPTSKGEGRTEYVAIYLDGKHVSRQVQNGIPLDFKSLTSVWDTRFIIAPSMYANGNNVPFAIDELKIWDFAKTEFDLD